jgi:hypothetical protein
MIRVSRHSILRDRADKPRFIKDTFPFLFAVTLVAAAIVVPYSIASISLLDNGGDTLKGSRIDDVKEKAIDTAVSYGDSSTSPVPVQTKSSSSSDADNTASSTPVPPPSGVRSEEIVAEPALMLTPDRKAGATAIETSHGSTQGPSTVQTAPSELSAPQERIAPPVSTADSASATAIETSHGSTQGRSTVETAPSELSAPQEGSAPPASITDAASATAIETSHGSTQGRSTVETGPPALSAPQEGSAPPASITDAASATAIETSHGSTQGRSTVETGPPELSAPKEGSAPPASITDAASATAIETSHGSTRGRSTDQTAPAELSVPQEVSAQPAPTADAANAAQRAAAVTIPLAISDEERDQVFRNFKIQRNGHTNLDQDTATERGFDATYSRGAPPLRHATSHRQDAAEAEHKTTRKLNRLELSRLLKDLRASR